MNTEEYLQTEVSIVPCADYSPETVAQAMEAVLQPLGGLEWVRTGMRIVIKANLVSFLKPERAATTHPALLCQLVKMLVEKGAQVIIGDSPGGLYNAVYVNRVYKATGMHKTVAAGAELNQNFEVAYAEYPEGKVLKNFQYTAYLDHADAIINFCKLKTHGMMGMSAAAKNMFGAIPGVLKPEYHYKYANAADFARMLVDIDCYFKPYLNIVDAVIGMEGNGPTAGTPRHIGAVLASYCPHKLDFVCAKLIGLNKETVPTLTAAFERGLIPESVEDLHLNCSLEPFMIKDYKLIQSHSSIFFKMESKTFFGKIAANVAKMALQSKPDLKERDKCIGCGECAKVCPAKAIEMKNRLPHIDRGKCICCFCCQEFCPKGAMQVKRPVIAKIINGKAGK